MLHRLTRPTLNFGLRPATNFQRSRLPAAIVILLLARVALGRRVPSIAAARPRSVAAVAPALPGPLGAALGRAVPAIASPLSGRSGLTVPPIVTRSASAILIGRRLHVAAARIT